MPAAAHTSEASSSTTASRAVAHAVQTKVIIGQVNDSFEREADTVADRVEARQPVPAISTIPAGGLSPTAQRQVVEEEKPLQRQVGDVEEEEVAQPLVVQRQAVEEEEELTQRQLAEEEPVQRQPVPEEEPIQSQRGTRLSLLQRQVVEEEEEPVQREGGGVPQISPATAATIRSPGAGRPMPPDVRSRIEPQVGADLRGVRIHTGPSATHAAGNLRARAFTHRNHIFLGAGESTNDLRLMAHEAAHVVQQRAVPLRRAASSVQREAASAGRQPTSSSPPDVQRLIPDFILEEMNDYARYIPGWTLFTILIGFNPLLGEAVERTPINLLEGLMGLAGPFGILIFDALRVHGIIQDAFAWVEGELSRLNLSRERIEETIEAAWEDVSLIEGFEYNLGVVRRHFGGLYDDVVSFARSLVSHIVDMIKEAAIGVAEDLLAENRAWALIKKILGRDPLRDEPVEATPTEILEDFLLLIGREQHLEQMQERGTVEATANWLATQIVTFMSLLAELRGLISRTWEAIQPENLPNLMDNLRTLTVEVGSFLQRVWNFASTVAAKVVELIKDALLGWLSSFAHEVPGFHLLTVILGRNPFTGEPVPRTAENLIRGFITLLPGGTAIYQQLAETGTIARAAARIEGAMTALGITWEFIVGLFTGLWERLSIEDLAAPLDAFARIVARFGEPISRLFAFVNVVLREMFFILLEMMSFPSNLIGSIISNAMQAIEDIKNDPIGFLMNMLQAIKLGFENFFGNILTHLVGGLADWLFRGLRDAGIEPPTDLSLRSVLDFVLQVLGLSMERIWEKLAERIGQENVDRIRGAIDRLTGIWNFVRDVQERGVAAIWGYIQSQISGLWDMVLEKAQEWIMERIINRAIQWLLSLLDPTGIMPVINSFIAFFNAVQSAVEYLRDILAIVNDYVTTLANVARGTLAAGAQKLEQGLANAIPIAIGFLANQFGLGNIGEKIQEIVAGIRGIVDRALDWLLDRAVSVVQSVLRMLGFGVDEESAPEAEGGGQLEEEPFQLGEERHRFRGRFVRGSLVVEMASNGWAEFNGRLENLQRLYVIENRNNYSDDTRNRLSQALNDIADVLIAVVQDVEREQDEAEKIRKANEGIDRLEAMFSPLGGAPFYIQTEGGFEPPHHRFSSAPLDAYGRATSAVGDPVSRASLGQGGPPTRDPPGIKILQGVTGMLTYQRGHLVAGSTERSLGGPGNDDGNLIPVSPITNASMRDGPERAARDAIYDEIVHPPNMLRYTARSQYRGIGAFENWLTSNMGAAAGSANRLYQLASTNAELNASTVHAALGGSSQLPLASVQANLDAIRKQLAYYFLAYRINISIEILQGPATVSPSHTVDNHQGVSLP